MALHGRGVLTFALGSGLFVELSCTQFGEQAGFFYVALEPAHGHFKRLIFFDSYSRHTATTPFGNAKGAYYSSDNCVVKALSYTLLIPEASFLPMLVLGIETSCDDTGVALYHSIRGLLAHALYTQATLHAEYGGVVPELASRDHIRHVLPLTRAVLSQGRCTVTDLDAIAYTEGPGLAGALLVGASIAHGMAYALGVPALGIHHLEGHLLAPLMEEYGPQFPFIALLVSGGHTQLMRVARVGDYELLGETLDDAAGEAFDKTAQLLGLGYPGGPALAGLAERGRPGRVALPRPMLHSGDLDFSFSGLKTAVLNQVKGRDLDAQARADVAAEFQAAIVDVLVAKSFAALKRGELAQLVVAGGVGANSALRARLMQGAAKKGLKVFFPAPEFCTDNGAMIAFAAAMRLQHTPRLPSQPSRSFSVQPRWPLAAFQRVTA